MHQPIQANHALSEFDTSPYGSHYCHFYADKGELAEVLVRFVSKGLEQQQACICCAADPLGPHELKRLLEEEIGDVQPYIEQGQLEICDAAEWYLYYGQLNKDRVIARWRAKLERALAAGFAGVRATGNVAGIPHELWQDFFKYEASLGSAIEDHRFIVLCSYPAHLCAISEITDLSGSHDHSLCRHNGEYLLTANHEKKRAAQGNGKSARSNAPVRPALVREITPRKPPEHAEKEKSVRIRLLCDAAHELLTSTDPDAAARTIFRLIADRLELDAYFNFLVNDAADGLRLGSCAGIRDEIAKQIARVEFGQGVCGTVALTRKAIEVDEVQSSREPMVALVKSLGIRAYACNPLIAGGKLVGTLSFGTRRRDRFSEDDLSFFRTIAHYVAIARERFQIQEELREADRNKDQFLAMLGHELRNPIAAIKSGVELLKRPGAAKRLENMIPALERQTSHLVCLVDDLLDASRVSQGKITLKPETLMLQEIVRRAADAVRPEVELRRHTLTVNMPETELSLLGDATRLEQVVVNLLSNAVKYTPEGGAIAVGLSRENDTAVLSVRDNGMGIPLEKQKRVFELFSQLDQSLHRSSGGLGIGLALVKKLVELHDGVVSLQSDGLGHGCEITVRLPIRAFPAAQAVHGAAPAEEPIIAPGMRFLVVDDNEDVLSMMRALLEEHGQIVETAADGVAAVEAALRQRPDAVLLDIGLPRLNGYEVARRIRQEPRLARSVLIAISGYGQAQDRRLAMAAGFDHFLTKPVSYELIARACAARRAGKISD